MLNECTSCRSDRELNVYGVCEPCWWNNLTPGERVLARSLHHVLIVQDGQESLGIEIARLAKAVENLSRLIKIPSEELDEAIGQAKRLMAAFAARLKKSDEEEDDGGQSWQE